MDACTGSLDALARLFTPDEILSARGGRGATALKTPAKNQLPRSHGG